MEGGFEIVSCFGNVGLSLGAGKCDGSVDDCEYNSEDPLCRQLQRCRANQTLRHTTEPKPTPHRQPAPALAGVTAPVPFISASPSSSTCSPRPGPVSAFVLALSHAARACAQPPDLSSQPLLRRLSSPTHTPHPLGGASSFSSSLWSSVERAECRHGWTRRIRPKLHSRRALWVCRSSSLGRHRLRQILLAAGAVGPLAKPMTGPMAEPSAGASGLRLCSLTRFDQRSF